MLKMQVSPGINPTDLILNVVITEGSGPKKGIYKEWNLFQICNNTIQIYRTV